MAYFCVFVAFLGSVERRFEGHFSNSFRKYGFGRKNLNENAGAFDFLSKMQIFMFRASPSTSRASLVTRCFSGV